jgi:hypothetical protein
MAGKLDMIWTFFPWARLGEPRGKSRSQQWRWQCGCAAVLLAALLGAGQAWADTDVGIAYMKQGYYVKALAELIPPAQDGEARAQVNLAAIYYYGEGVSANFDKAFHWYHAAAIQGDPDGQIGLAIMYAGGQGVTADLAIAHMWLTLAVDTMPGTPDRVRVSTDRDAIGERLSAAQLQESATLVQAWYKNHQAP